MNSRKKSHRTERFLAILLGVVLLSSITPINSAFAANVNFSFPSTPSDGNISNTPGAGSNSPFVGISGTNVFVLWQDGSDILFANSTDSGETFSSGTSIGSSSSTEPKLAIEGSNVFAIWNDGTDVKFNRSTNSGQSFVGAQVILSSSTSTTPEPQLAIADGTSSSPDDVYAVWKTDGASGDIFFVKSSDNGANFGSILDIGGTDVGISDPQIDTIGDNVYVIWQNQTDISFAQSTNNGGSFTVSDIGDSSGFSSTESFPQVKATGSFVYTVWQQGTDIMFSNSTDSGASFSTPVDIGNSGGSSRDSTPRLAISGSDVYVVWRDGAASAGDVKFIKSSDNGVTFGTEINLSGNSEESASPEISVSGTNVFVTWEDSTPSSGSNSDILFKISDNNGDTFGGVSTVISNSGESLVPSIASSGSTPFIAWQDATPGINEVLFKLGTLSAIGVSFDETQYKLGDTATITVTTVSGGTISADITSDTDSGGISVSLTEGPSGTYTGTISFTESGTSSGTILKASTGDTITASFGGTDGTASIFPRSVDFSGITSFNMGTIGNARVTDQNANTDTLSPDTVTITVTSSANTGGITLILTETGDDTGIFGGSSGVTQSDMIFVEVPSLVSLAGTESITISQSDDTSPGSGGSNNDALVIEQVSVTVTSTTDATGFSLVLTETGINTGVFENDLLLSDTATDSGTGTILVTAGDFILIENTNGKQSRLLVTPANQADGALEVTTPSDVNVKATHLDASITVTFTDAFASGGGGGGLVSPGLVVNALAGVSGGGGSPTSTLNNLLSSRVIDVPEEVEQMVVNHDSYSPLLPMDPNSFENFDLPLVINDQGFVLGGFTNTLQTQTIQTNTPVTMKFTVYTSDKVQHFSLYTNLRDTNDSIGKSDTQILYNDGKDLTIIDPQGFFSNAKITVTDEDPTKKYILVEMTFAKEMETSHIITRMWDSHLRSGDTHILDAIKVESGVPEFVPIPQETEEVQVEELTSQEIPKWVKSNAEWWVDQQIDDESFVSGIQYLINNGIMYIPNTETVNSSVTEIPDWVKNNAEWWVDNQISDDDFVKAMEWLVINGVISIE